MLKSSSVRLISICDDCATQPSFFLRFKDSKFCTPDTTTPYLNLPEVKAAFHTLSNITWTECRFKSLAKPLSYFTWFCLSIMQQKQCFSSFDVGVCSVVVNNQYSVASVIESMLPVYRFLQGRGLKMWIYRYTSLHLTQVSNLLNAGPPTNMGGNVPGDKTIHWINTEKEPVMKFDVHISGRLTSAFAMFQWRYWWSGSNNRNTVLVERTWPSHRSSMVPMESFYSGTILNWDQSNSVGLNFIETSFS